MVSNRLGRWQHVLKLWNAALSESSIPQFDRWLSAQFAQNPQYGGQDRRFYREVLFTIVRHAYFAAFCEFIFTDTNFSITEDALKQKAQLFAAQINSPETLWNHLRTCATPQFFQWIVLRSSDSQKALFSIEIGGAYEAHFTALQAIFARTESPELKCVFASVPLWFCSSLQVRFNNPAEFLEALNTRPPVWLRLNKNEHASFVQHELQKHYGDNARFQFPAIRLNGAKNLQALLSFQKGYFEVQDWASQMISAEVQATPEQSVWDACAGGGGKTLQLASILQNKGTLYASDIRSYKLEELQKRCHKAGFHNVQTFVWDGQKQAQSGRKFDWVLVDAPCSSAGTWRRSPDAKYRLSLTDISKLSELQLQILNTAAQSVTLNGRLVYATCSWLTQENEHICTEFLKRCPQFELINQRLLGSPEADSDTMFVAQLRRVCE